MRPYEVMVIFDVGLEDADIRAQVDRVLELIRTRGDTPGQVDHWGRRTFAYEMKHRSEGYYVLVEATAEPATMAEVDRLLALEDSVLRHKVIRQPEKAAGRRRATRSRSPQPAPSAARSGPASAPAVRSEPASAPAVGVSADDASAAS
jgi:small subunit ribosomal protein S6